MDIKVDGEGFLVDRDDWSEEVMYELASRDGVELTEDHVKYIKLAREMFDDEGTVPPLRVFSKATGGDRKGTHLNELFNGGPMKKIAKYGALPKPTGCT